MLKSGPLKKLKLNKSFILQISDIASSLPEIPSGVSQAVEIEDLVPLEISLAAVFSYFNEIDPSLVTGLTGMSIELVKSKVVNGKSIYDALDAACKSINSEFHLDKIGFSRAVLRVVHESAAKTDAPASLKQFEQAMTALFTRLAQMQRESLKEISQERVTQRVNRAKKSFMQDHPQIARREEAAVLFEEIASALNDEPESDAIRTFLDRMGRNFKLKDDVTKPIEDFELFKEQLEKIVYADVILADDRGKSELFSGGNIVSRLNEAGEKESGVIVIKDDSVKQV